MTGLTWRLEADLAANPYGVSAFELNLTPARSRSASQLVLLQGCSEANQCRFMAGIAAR